MGRTSRPSPNTKSCTMAASHTNCPSRTIHSKRRNKANRIRNTMGRSSKGRSNLSNMGYSHRCLLVVSRSERYALCKIRLHSRHCSLDHIDLVR